MLNAGGNNQSWGIFRNGQLSGLALSGLNSALNVELGNPKNTDQLATASPECYAVLSAFWAVGQLNNGLRLGPAGGIALYWNSKANLTTTAAAIFLNPELVNLGRSDKVAGNVFFGLKIHPFGSVRPNPTKPRPKNPKPGRVQVQ